MVILVNIVAAPSILLPHDDTLRMMLMIHTSSCIVMKGMRTSIKLFLMFSYIQQQDDQRHQHDTIIAVAATFIGSIMLIIPSTKIGPFGQVQIRISTFVR